MNRIEREFSEKQPFIGFLVAGDGGIDYSVDCALQLIEGGVDILEIGFPFSDPVADGPVIQKAAERSLALGTTHSTILEIARRIRNQSAAPLVLFSYFNPLFKRGEEFLQELKQAGFDAILVVDLAAPVHGKNPFFDTVKKAGLDSIFVITPSTSEERLTQIAEQSQGFLYYACQKGTTGVRTRLPDDVAFHLSRIRKKTTRPIAVGFGIADAGSAEAALSAGDGFVVGSAFVRLMEQKADPVELKQLAEKIDPRVVMKRQS